MVFKYRELSHQAAPLEENLFEWHFTVRGPSDTDFEVGLLHNTYLLIVTHFLSFQHHCFLNISFHQSNHLHLTVYDRVVFTMAASSCLQITQWNPRTLSYLLQMAGRKLSYFKASFIFNYFDFDNVRFEVGKKICLSISGHHPETWQVNLSA